MGYWNREMWDLSQGAFVTGHFYHFYIFISYPALVILTLILAIIFYRIYWKEIGRSSH